MARKIKDGQKDKKVRVKVESTEPVMTAMLFSIVKSFILASVIIVLTSILYFSRIEDEMSVGLARNLVAGAVAVVAFGSFVFDFFYVTANVLRIKFSADVSALNVRIQKLEQQLQMESASATKSLKAAEKIVGEVGERAKAAAGEAENALAALRSKMRALEEQSLNQLDNLSAQLWMSDEEAERLRSERAELLLQIQLLESAAFSEREIEEGLRQEIADLLMQVVLLQKSCRQKEVLVSVRGAYVRRLQQELAAANGELHRVQRELQGLRAEHDECSGRETTLTTRISELEAEVVKLKRAAAAPKAKASSSSGSCKRCEKLRTTLQDLQTRIQVFEEKRDELAGTFREVASLFSPPKDLGEAVRIFAIASGTFDAASKELKNLKI